MCFTFTDKRTSILIDEQVPKFLHEYGPKFIKFIEKYYEWLECSRVEVSVEYLDKNFSDLDFDLENKSESMKPKIKGLHTNSLSIILSSEKIDRNNYILHLKHYNKDFETDVQIVNPSSPTNFLTKKHSIRNEISKGYTFDEELIFENDPFKELTDSNNQRKVKITVKSFIQNSDMASKNSWNSNDIDLTLNSNVDFFMKEFMQFYPLSFPNLDGSFDINDKIERNYTLEDFKRFLVKHSREFYQSKGTENSFRYLFRTIYNKEIDIYYPEDDVLKASDNHYYESKILRVYPNNFINLNDLDLKSRYIFGENSNASAVIEEYFFKNINNKNYIEFKLNPLSIEGDFDFNENIRIVNEEDNFQNIGTVINSLNDVKVLDTSTSQFEIGERIILDKNLERVNQYEVVDNFLKEYIELEVESLQSGEIYDFEVLNSGNSYSLGDEVKFDNTDCFIKSKPHRCIMAYVSKVCAYGSIKKIKVVCKGSGYISLPKVVSIGNKKYDENDPNSAVIKFVSRNLGKIKKVNINKLGHNYNYKKVKVDLNGDSNYDLELNFGSVSSSVGVLLNNNGYLSDTKVLQDSFYYQKFSYVIKSDIKPKEYRNFIKRFVHPAGTKFFGEYYISTKVDSKIKVSSDKLSEIELNDRNYIGKYSNVVLDEWSLYENFDNVEIRQNDLIPTLIEKEDDFKFHRLSGSVNLTEGTNIVNGVGTNFSSSLSSGDFVMISNQGFYVESVNNDLEIIVSQESNQTISSQNISVRTKTLADDYIFNIPINFYPGKIWAITAIETDPNFQWDLDFMNPSLNHNVQFLDANGEIVTLDNLLISIAGFRGDMSIYTYQYQHSLPIPEIRQVKIIGEIPGVISWSFGNIYPILDSYGNTQWESIESFKHSRTKWQ